MGECIRLGQSEPQSSGDVLTEILRKGAQSLLQQAIEAEVDTYLQKVNPTKYGQNAIRNGYLPERSIQTGIGDVAVTQPRVRRKPGAAGVEPFRSSILPPYLRRTKSIEELIPWLYLKGISTGDFHEALAALLGDGAKGLSASTVTRLKGAWQEEYDKWQQRRFDGKRYVYIWADGIHFGIRLSEDERMCILVIMGATVDGTKELLAVSPGYRESAMSWKEVLLSLRNRGLSVDPRLAIADGALGFWAALDEVCPETKQQRCWVHKTANVLDKLPKSKQAQAKRMIHNIYNQPSKAEAEVAFDEFLEVFDPKYPKAAECLQKDRARLLTFYDFPAENWCHIRTTNAIESTFATVRLRTHKTKGCGSSTATLMMVFKLVENAAKTWKKIRGYERLAEVIDIRWRFVDGVREEAKAA